MVEADPVMRAARNGFMALIVLLLGMSVYEFVFVDDSGPVVPILWAVGVVVFYGSKYYYQRSSSGKTGNG